MKVVDIVVLTIIIVIVGLIIYISFWKNRKKPCHNCPYCKNCNNECDDKKQNKFNYSVKLRFICYADNYIYTFLFIMRVNSIK